MLLLSMNLAGGCVLIALHQPMRERLAKVAAGLVAGMIFALLTAPVWYVFVETLRTSYTSYDDVAAFQIQPSLLLGTFDEAFYRALETGGHVFNPSANFVLLAGLLYFLATLRIHFADRALATLAVFSLVPASLAFGLVPPEWIKSWPLLSSVGHLDNTFTCVLIVLWAVMAGAGFAAASRRLARPEGRGDLAVAALLLFALVFQFTAYRHAVHRLNFGGATALMALKVGQSLPLTPFLRVYMAVLIAAAVAFGLLARRALKAGRTGPAVGTAMALCLMAMLWRGGMQASSGFEDTVVHAGRRVDFRAPSGAVAFLREAGRTEPSRAIGLQNNLFPGWSAMYGIETANGPDALINPRYRELVSLAPLDRIWDWRLYLTRDRLRSARPFLDSLNVRHYVDLRSDQGALGAVLKLDRAGDLDVYESPSAWPRAFFTNRVSVYQQAGDYLEQVLSGDGRPFAAAQAADLAAEPALGALVGPLSGRTIAPATDYRLTEDSTAFTVHAPEPGVAVLVEAFWPGYPHAEVDGRPVRVVRINHAFEGVPIDSAGDHRIVIAYRPRRFTSLLAMAAAAGAAMIGLVSIASRRGTAPAARTGPETLKK
jgi:hypothetical protein